MAIIRLSVPMKYEPKRSIEAMLPHRIALKIDRAAMRDLLAFVRAFVAERNSAFDIRTMKILSVQSTTGLSCETLEISGKIGYSAKSKKHGDTDLFELIIADNGRAFSAVSFAWGRSGKWKAATEN